MRLRESIVERISVIEFGVNNRGSKLAIVQAVEESR